MEQADQIVALVYAAAAEETGWTAAMLALQRAVGASNGGLFAAPDGMIETLHGSSFDPADVLAYTQHYHRLDPWLQRLRGPVLQGGPATRATVGESLLAQDAYHRSEFYNDFARRIGLEWIVGAIGRLGPAGSFHLGLHRPKGREGFGASELALLEVVVPHIRRGLQLRERLRGIEALPALMLDALSEAALVVDSELRPRHVNLAAARLCGPGSAIRLVQESPRPGAPLRLRVSEAGAAARLTALVRDAALAGGSGGAMRLRPDGKDGHAPLALLVSPLPARLRPAGNTEPSPGAAAGLALILLRPLDRVAPSPALLQALFGCSAAEAEVAAGLAGGNGAEWLAERRGVSPATIRAQVRALLEKTGTQNLRELEGLLASLSRPAGSPGR